MALRASSGPVTELPTGYPAYCIYLPTGMSEDFEKEILSKLQAWGDSMGQNLFVAPWNIGDPSYQDLTKNIKFNNRPAIIMMDRNEIQKDSVVLIVDDPILATNASRLTKLLPILLDLILRGENKDAIKKAMQVKQIALIQSLLDPIKAIAGKINITAKWNGISMGLKPS
jgi:hypothetical protein